MQAWAGSAALVAAPLLRGALLLLGLVGVDRPAAILGERLPIFCMQASVAGSSGERLPQ